MFDVGSVVEFAYDLNTTTGVQYKVVAKQKIPKHSDVFLIDHAWYLFFFFFSFPIFVIVCVIDAVK